MSENKIYHFDIRKQIFGENLLYGFVWLIIYLVPFMNSRLTSEQTLDLSEVLLTWIKLTPYFMLFIINNQVLVPYFLAKNNSHIVGYVAVSLFLICATFMSIEFTARSYGYGVSEKVLLWAFEWYWSVLFGIIMFVLNIAVMLLYRSMTNDEDTAKLQYQNAQAEMEYLKYQINPHFFMNTLNNIHALIDIDTESAKKCLIELSNMMRYVVYESADAGISLKKDIQFIENYISLMRIRYAQDIDIKLTYPQNLPANIGVPPLVLIIFVENAFKHGIGYLEHPFIHINISLNEKSMQATISNSLPEQEAGKSHGIGLQNVSKRLKLLFGDNYNLSTEVVPNSSYTTILTIPILKL